jgi:hypothetical protein
MLRHALIEFRPFGHCNASPQESFCPTVEALEERTLLNGDMVTPPVIDPSLSLAQGIVALQHRLASTLKRQTGGGIGNLTALLHKSEGGLLGNLLGNASKAGNLLALVGRLHNIQNTLFIESQLRDEVEVYISGSDDPLVQALVNRFHAQDQGFLTAEGLISLAETLR